MAQTLLQKILSRQAGHPEQESGDLIRIKPELLLASNESINRIIQKFYDSGMKSVTYPEKVILINNASPVDSVHQSSETSRFQEFVYHHQIKTYYELGRSGCPSNVVINNGHIVPGMLTVSSESQFSELGVLGCLPVLASENEMALSLATGEIWIQIPGSARFTLSGKLGSWSTGTDVGLYILKNYDLPDDPRCVMEFSGEGISELPLHERFNLVRVLSSYGYDYVLFEADTEVLEYLNQRTDKKAYFSQADSDAEYMKEYEVNLTAVKPMIAVAVEGQETQIVPADNLKDKPVHKVMAGATGAGRYEDFQIALKLMRYNPVHKNVQMMIMPSDHLVFSDLINNGLAGIFLDLGCEIYPASFFKVLKDGLGIYTKVVNVMTTSPVLFQTARNTEGHHIYLGSILTSFASAVNGSIIHPKALEMKLRKSGAQEDKQNDTHPDYGHKHETNDDNENKKQDV
jgi:3-isopropylmalate/(R)-2-methylmalate dehydratase large subunit